MPGHEKAARRPDSERLRADTRKTPLQGERGARPGSRFPGRGCLRRREQHAHEPLIRRPTLAEVPLAGLSLTTLDADTAKALAEYKGDWLYLQIGRAHV